MPIRNKLFFYSATILVCLYQNNKALPTPDPENKKNINLIFSPSKPSLDKAVTGTMLTCNFLGLIFAKYITINNNITIKNNTELASKIIDTANLASLSDTEQKNIKSIVQSTKEDLALNYFSKQQIYNFSYAALMNGIAETMTLPYIENKNYIHSETKDIFIETFRSNTMHKDLDAILLKDIDKKDKKEEQIIQEALFNTVSYTLNNAVLRVALKKLSQTKIAKNRTIQIVVNAFDDTIPQGKTILKEGTLMAATVGLQTAQIWAWNMLMSWLKEQQ